MAETFEHPEPREAAPAGSVPPASPFLPAEGNAAPELRGLTPPAQVVMPPAQSEATVISKPGGLEPARPADARLDSQATYVPPTPTVPRQENHLGQIIRGERLGVFELQDTLGVGGMATVLRATDTSLDRTVALKVLPPEMARDPENVKRFHHEARAAAKLDHENIARVYAFGTDRGLNFIAYEFVEGETLRARMQRRGKLPVAEVLPLALQIARGLAHAADRGVVHRDIKPSNILLTPEGQAKLVDMGLARSQVLPADGGLTHSGVTLGTFDYISPEQAIDPRQADCRSDLYSLGCTLYHALTGHSPVPQGTAMRKLQAHQNEAPVDPRDGNPDVTDEVAQVLGRLMAKDPRDRYQHPREVVAILEQLQPRVSLGLGAPTRRESRQPDLWPTLLLGGLLMLAVAALNTWLYPPAPGAPWPTIPVLANQTPLPTGSVAGVAQPSKPSSDRQLRVAQTSDELRQHLADQPTGVIQLAGPRFDFDLGLVVQPESGTLTLRAAPGVMPRLRLTRTLANAQEPGRQALITHKGGTLRLEGLRLDIADATGSQVGELAALVLEGGTLACDDCVFVQEADPAWFSDEGSLLNTASRELAAVKCLAGSRTGESTAEFRRCLFTSGDTAIIIANGAKVTLRDCVVGPYRLPFRMGQTTDGDRLPLHLSLEHCSSVLGRAFVGLQGRGVVRLDLQETVLAPATSGTTPGRTFMLFGQTDPARVELRGVGNVFSQLDSLAAVEVGGSLQPLARSYTELRGLVSEASPNFVTLDTRRPWQQPQDLARLAQLSGSNLVQAVRLRTQQASLRSGPGSMKGARQLLGEPLYDTLEPLRAESSGGNSNPLLEARELLVDGVGRMPGTFVTLDQALAAANLEDDVRVLLKVNGPVQVRGVNLADRRLTLRGAAGFLPELVPHPDLPLSPNGEAVLFKLQDGSLTLEQLAVRLTATLRESPRLQALVAVTGGGKVRMTACQATLAGDDDLKTALVLLGSPPTLAPMGLGNPMGGPPTVEVIDSLVRGRGEVVAVRQYRPFLLETRNAAVALQGAFLVLEGHRRGEMEALPDAATILFDRVSVFATQGLIWFRSGAPGLTHLPLKVEAVSHCLFLAADSQPLIRADGPRSEAELKRRLQWKGRQNLYGSAAVLTWQPMDSTSGSQQYDGPRWRELWGRDEDQPRYLRGLRLAGNLEQRSSLESITPAAFRPLATDTADTDLDLYGADLTRVYSQEATPMLTDRP